MIPAKIVEKAAEAKYRRAFPDADLAPWDSAPETTRTYCRDAIVRALTPVYADIQAEALREVHTAIQRELDSDSLMARALRRECNQTAQDAVGWVQSVLQDRADELDGGLPVPAWTVPFTKIPGGSTA